MHDAEVVAHDEADLDHRQHRQHHQRQQEGELDGGLTALACASDAVAPGSPATGAGEPTTLGHDGSTFSITESNSCEIAWLPVAQVIRSVAIATAPRITRAYSAVD